jgi:hypothetical protein
MNAFLRTLVAGAALAGFTYAGYEVLSRRDLRRTLREMEQLQQETEQKLAAREAMLDRLGRSRRVAHIQVLEQHKGPGGEVARTRFAFIEIDDHGREIARQVFDVPGDVLFVDAWSIKFSHVDVAGGDPLRGQSLILLRRVYSDRMPPSEGYAIDLPGAVPPAYAAGEAAEFEKRLWEQFWTLATDPAAADAAGVRVAQGEAVYKPIRAGATYELVVDAAGGMSLTPLRPRTAAGSG